MQAKKRSQRNVSQPSANTVDELISTVRKLIDQHQDSELQLKSEMERAWEESYATRIEIRLDGIERQLLTLADCFVQLKSSATIPAPSVDLHSADLHGHGQSNRESIVENYDPNEHQVSGLSTASFLGSWQQQRDQMLSSLSGNGPVSTCETELTAILVPPVVNGEDQILDKATPEDLDQIQALKEQLQHALRDTEVELSIQRAKISQERAALEHRAALIEQRERELNRKTEAPKKGGMMNRLKSFLGKTAEGTSANSAE